MFKVVPTAHDSYLWFTYPIMLPSPYGVHDGQLRLFVDSAVTYKISISRSTTEENKLLLLFNRTCSETEALTKKVGTLVSLDGQKPLSG